MIKENKNKKRSFDCARKFLNVTKLKLSKKKTKKKKMKSLKKKHNIYENFC